MLEHQGRQAYLDRVRGLAVLVMIEAHVLDGWTLVAERHRPGFIYAMILGGFAAPLFLFLAGVSMVLSAESRYRKTGDLGQSWRAVHKRGWQIFGLAFLFRHVDFAGFIAHVVNLLKVDILNVMGPALVLAALAGGLATTRAARVTVFAAAAVAIAMLTPIVRQTTLLNGLPAPVVVYFRPGGPVGANFTLFPWAGFVFIGAIVGMIINSMRRAQHPMRLQMGLGAVSILVAAAAYGASYLPSIYQRSDYWTSSPTFFFVRAGIIALVLPVAYLWERAPWRGIVSRWSPLEEFGKSSLFVYWIHVEMVYGFLGRPLRRNLSFEGAVLAYVLFTAFLLSLVLLKNRRLRLPKPGPLPATGATPASI